MAAEAAVAGMAEAAEARTRRPLVIGIAGGSGSGKTSISDAVVERIGTKNVTKITHDSYYRDLGEASFEERKKTNFDHPSALETELLVKHLRDLRAGRSVEMPVYDFTTHSRRKDETVTISPTPVIIVDGILIFSEEELRDLFDIKIFVDTDADIRFIRRLRRDTLERGRSSEEVAKQYLTTVRPMHIQFVEPTKRYADIIIPEGGYDSHVAMDMLIAHMNMSISSNAGDGTVASPATRSLANGSPRSSEPASGPGSASLDISLDTTKHAEASGEVSTSWC
ncbi:Uridine-cytidine kinase 2 [Hondaea fermentalgiana]|uniref:Uridine kinase n=1 Tax=Hondaea fermentalgiana TaxID=2315210 RepID=A0A2R5G874_9STRA|nr:Uridine-cytidine kinase 2 [Hondaea fermentalgiana]|eukprot:GBG24241.1 Uridine-cytidine kinase 2 [Hondaea fermentalgiana]